MPMTSLNISLPEALKDSTEGLAGRPPRAFSAPVKKRRLIFSDAAVADILEQAEWYVAQSGRPLARRWEKAVRSTTSRVVNRPGAGALCSFQLPELKGVRRTAIAGFPKHLRHL
ncbi:MAG TPA: hypothetical protein VGM18_04740 [Candidatus Sulfotelmatobacter sp.]